MKKILFVLMLLYPSLCFAQISASGSTKYDYVTYAGYTGSNSTCAWDIVSGAAFYQMRVKHFEQNKYIDVGITPTLQFTYTPSKSGHYIIEVRSVHEDANHVLTYSAWAASTDSAYATVDGQPKGWWLYRYVQPPGTITVTK